MFNKNFYPTPEKALDLLIGNYNFHGKYVLEPSAGKGNIIDYIHKNTKHVTIDAIEIENDLQSILYDKDCMVIYDDFLKFETHSEYDVIVMNPPFDQGDKHLLKAIEMAENQSTKGCQVFCILNKETIKNDFTNTRKTLNQKLSIYESKISFESGLFVNSERATSVDVALISVYIDNTKTNTQKLFNQIISDVSTDQSGQISNFALSTLVTHQQIAEKEQEIKMYVRLYNDHIKLLKDAFSSIKKLELYNSMFSKQSSVNYLPAISRSLNSDNSYDSFLLSLRKEYWGKILNTKDFMDILTHDARKKLYDQVVKASRIEITLENIEKMLISLIVNKNQILKDALLNKFNDLTDNHMANFSKNIHYYNGWKTNDAFKVNNKVILPPLNRFREETHELYNTFHKYWVSVNKMTYSSIFTFLDDLSKAFSIIDSKPLDLTFYNLGDGLYESDSFILKCYKKGTTHLTFKDKGLLEKFNFFVGQQRGWLPTSDEIKKDESAYNFVKENFPDININCLITEV